MRVSSAISAKEFLDLDLPEDRDWELHEGEIVEMTFPAWIHREIQIRVAELLKKLLPGYRILVEMPFLVGENVRSADVGATLLRKVQRAKALRILSGAPELVVEVLSLSNRDIPEYKKFCFDHGTQAFWLITPGEKTVAVTYRRNRQTIIYEEHDSIPLVPLDRTAILSVQSIFDGII